MDSDELFSSQERRTGGQNESVSVTVPDQPLFGEIIVCFFKISICLSSDLAGLIDSALKKHISPLKEEMKKLQKEVLSCDSEHSLTLLLG